MANLDPTCQIFDGWKHVIYLVPKFHLPAHVAACRTRFSFNFTKGVGRTDGEAPERGWAEVNPLAASTKEMGPGSRRDTLDAHFGDYNWRKVVGMGESYFFQINLFLIMRITGGSLFRKMKAAGSDMYDHVVSHSDYESSLPPASVAHWTAEVEAWEKDASQPNPYALTIISE
jgi:hypothetical protein